MTDRDFMEVHLTDIDLNQEPADPPLQSDERHGSILNDLETAHDRIEERIRQLEAFTARARQCQRWRQLRNSMETNYSNNEMMLDEVQRGVLDERNGPDRRKGCKRDSIHLATNALRMNSEIIKTDKEEDSFYDCNICLDLAREPVLTGCGHLFCWSCFYQVSNVESTAKECPVCKGEVSDNTVIPIYGNGGHEHVSETEFRFKIPPRPKAPRVESIRQQLLNQGHSHVPVAEALRRIRISIGEVQEGQNPESATTGSRVRVHQVSRVLSESAASLSSLSSALTDAERLVEDLETAVNNQLLRNRGWAAAIRSNIPSFSIQSEAQHSLPNSTPSQSADVSELPIDPYSYFSLGRISVARSVSRDSQDTREYRRRRRRLN